MTFFSRLRKTETKLAKSPFLPLRASNKIYGFTTRAVYGPLHLANKHFDREANLQPHKLVMVRAVASYSPEPITGKLSLTLQKSFL